MEQANLLKVVSVWLVLQGFIVFRTESAAPVSSGLPTEIYVGNDETGARWIHTFSIQDPNGDSYSLGNTITAEKQQAAVGGTYDQFEVKLNSITGNYELWTTGSAFDYPTVDKYLNTVTATDTNSESSTPLAVHVNVVDNEQVTINNVEGAVNDLTLNALNTGQAVAVKTVDGTSALGSDLEFSLVSDPSFTPEFFTIDSSTGIIKTNRPLEYLDSADTTIYLTITAYDRVNQIQVYATQTVHLTNQNTIPTTTNMIGGLAETKVETLAIGTILFTVTTDDPDSSQSHTYDFDCIPKAAEDTFTLDTNGNFMVANTMDYEEISFFNCSFYIDDGIEEGGPFIYELTIENDNEAPIFSDIMYYVSAFEAAKGSVTFDPTLDCTDEDAGDSITFEFQVVNNSDRFSVDTSGLMTFNTDYDVDNNAMPTEVVLTVYCVDSGHIDGDKKTGSAQITITIYDANDNTPTFPSTTYTVTVTDTTTPGSVVGTILPTDPDSGTNGDFLCSELTSTTYSSYYAVGADCNIYLTKQIDFSSAQTQFEAIAADLGSTRRTGTTTVVMVFEQTPTTTTTTQATTTPYDFFDHGGNIALFVFALLMGLALLGLLTWCLMNFCCGSTCRNCGGFGRGRGRRERRYPDRRRPETPDSPPPKYKTKDYDDYEPRQGRSSRPPADPPSHRGYR